MNDFDDDPMLETDISADIVVVGSCNVDLITYTPRFPVVGETIEGTDFKQGFGGKGANQAVAAARLGVKVAIVARLGDDGFGLQTLENFKTQGVNASFVEQLPDVPSGVAPIFVDGEGRNFIVIVPGANMELTPSDLEPARETIRRAKAVVCQLEIKQETVRAAFEIAREAGVMTVLNPAPAATLIDGLLPLADLVLPNETELNLLTGMPVSTLPEVKVAAQELIRQGAKEVIVTLGERGAMRVTPTWAVHHAAVKLKPFDSTGAGDAFIGALVAQLVSGIKMPMAINFANAAAAISVTRSGTQTSFATRAEVEGAPAPESPPVPV
jgi:ribokinase